MSKKQLFCLSNFHPTPQPTCNSYARSNIALTSHLKSEEWSQCQYVLLICHKTPLQMNFFTPHQFKFLEDTPRLYFLGRKIRSKPIHFTSSVLVLVFYHYRLWALSILNFSYEDKRDNALMQRHEVVWFSYLLYNINSQRISIFNKDLILEFNAKPQNKHYSL